jgi:hypothetical protein
MAASVADQLRPSRSEAPERQPMRGPEMAASAGALKFPLLRELLKVRSAAVDWYPPPVQFAAVQAFAAQERPMRSTSRQVQEMKKPRRSRLQQPRCA